MHKRPVRDAFAGLPKGPIQLMYRMYRYILPSVRKELGKWRSKAEQIPDPELRSQALASITSKEFHCLGGSVYASGNLARRQDLIALITAFQTISDYLDNLCDRSTSMSMDDFRSLHQAMLDSIDPLAKPHDYYAHRQEKEDDGYLSGLVATCQHIIRKLPHYHVVQPYIQQLVSLYCDLQVYKHIDPTKREQALLDWWDLHRDRTPDLAWNEFAAATGSTLGVFILFLAAGEPEMNEETAQSVYQAYFPYVCSLHILLDYLIDQEEDERGGDLNFCSYFSDNSQTTERLEYMADMARSSCRHVPGASFHGMIVEGLMALYLSDPKVGDQQEVKAISRRLMRNSPWTRVFFWLNSRWIRGA